ncbi:PIK3AP1 [Branchiostoma lanceolatum]|uniref:PIK3AP1 protein n=1 Tax=Branchiostoma lanceolatum TaxID=7740 RepID=A0A8J9Z305_BRALA|nr:PIK3AP1 [Branchiostoma lanceolatum]
MAGAEGDDFYDLSIMYSPDGEQWSEFLSDEFRRRSDEIEMYFESIEQLPLHHSQEKAIKNSRCQFLLVSPDFTDLFSYTSFREFFPQPQQVVVLLCGVEHGHLEDIFVNMPGSDKWTILSTTDGVPTILERTFQVINSFEPEPDTESPYMPMAGKSQGEVGTEETYLPMDQSNKMEGQDLYEDMETKPPRSGVFEDTYMIRTVATPDSGSDDSGPPQRPPKPGKSRPEGPKMSKELQLVQPYTVASGSGERVVLIFKNTLPEGDSYTVEFQGNKQTSVVTATKENPYTLVLNAPDHPPETTKATVKCDSKLLGNATMVFVSKMQRLEELLSDVSKPIEFMCQSLGAEPLNLKTLDKILRDTFKKHMPPKGLGVFGIDQESEEEYAYHPEELPTLMHFVAKYGLKDMCASLLHCPGALNACSIANCDNNFPHNLAEKYGHMDLKKYIEDRIELGAILEEEMGSGDGYVDMDKELYMKMTRVDPAYGYMAMGMGKYYNTHSALREGGYYNIFPSDHSSVEEQPDYDRPFPVAIPDLDVYGEALMFSSTGFIKDILQGHEEEPDPDPEIYDDPDKHDPAPPHRPFSGMRGPSITRQRHSLKQPHVEESPTAKRRSQTLPVGFSLSSVTGAGASPSSGHDDLAMYPPGQQELIKLQKEVKDGVYTIEEALTMFKAWQMKERDRAMSFDQQKKEMDNLRASVQRRAKKGHPEVGPPIPKHGKDDGIYGKVLHRIRRSNSKEGGGQEPEAWSRQPRKTPGRPSYKRPGEGNRESTLSNSSSSSGGSRHSVMSTASLDSGMDVPPSDIPEERPPPIPVHIPRRPRPLSEKFDDDFIAKPVPPPPVSKRPLPREPPPPARPASRLKPRHTEPDMSPRLPPSSTPRPSLPAVKMSEVNAELAKKFGKLPSSSADDETSSDRRPSPRDSPQQPSSPMPPRPPQRGSNPQPPPRPPRKPMN